MRVTCRQFVSQLLSFHLAFLLWWNCPPISEFKVSAQLFFVNIVFFDPGMHFLYVNQAFYVPWCEKFSRILLTFVWIQKKHPKTHAGVIACSQKRRRSWSTWSLWSCGAVSKMLAWLEALKVDGIRRLHAYPTVSCRSWPVVTVDPNLCGFFCN